jgi:hypothetical protein
MGYGMGRNNIHYGPTLNYKTSLEWKEFYLGWKNGYKEYQTINREGKTWADRLRAKLRRLARGRIRWAVIKGRAA